ncbi:acetyl-CoA carboxylase, carboxyltransferase subunit beta [Acidaminobacter hydrogenoformans]|uniref:Acetyl-coenzyme A carboxylase carboxyl transferase subunit beta n=1 Tax=Acidaminobacter hydrogenoformans DSM 2784 TaxID=1120920 RepID=A0A1G5RY17_9FIRM|nr:acetyl-CoA carboxylase, carboxyltransferase subunit beta [Acidaminobacter hydrogenoformans]SCZ78640.1 acetyl-CoA carboxylase carboxyl transferase subunit beta [Acidaminobacter hydrogenoformans DSM 2784]
MKLDFLKRKKWVKLELSNQAWTSGGGQSPTAHVAQTPAVTTNAGGAQSPTGKSDAGVSLSPTKNPPGPDEVACPGCGTLHSKQGWARNLRVCPACGKHGRITSVERVAQILDLETFSPIAQEVTSKNPLKFPDYQEKLDKASLQSEAGDAVLTGTGRIHNIPAALFIMEPDFMMGSLGSAAGERITRLVETAIENRLPVIGFCASGGARMQEGILSLMQMAKTSAALGRLSSAGLPYIAVLTDPTTGGVTASYAMLGDVILAEPGALIGFAGQRVIEQTIRQSLPDGFQRAEFLVDKGFVDRIVHRTEMKAALEQLLKLHGFASVSVAAVTIESKGGDTHVS